MAQEEKAKAYDEAIEALRSLFAEQAIKHCDRVNIKDITNIFPELKESEDEKIRKNIIATIHLYYGESLDDEAKEMIAWLEKQGKNEKINEISYRIGIKRVLDNPGSYGLEKQGEQKFAEYNKEISTNLKDIVDKEANAIWKEESTDGCHLVIDSFNMFYGICMQIAETVVDYKKPAEWSKEDKINYNRIRTILCTHNDVREEEYKKLTSWLKSLRPQNKWEPSEEQMEALDAVIDEYNGYPEFDLLVSLKNDLKKLREK